MYSLGATVYEMVAGRPPFVGNTPNEVLNRHLKSPPETLVRFRRDVTPEFDTLVRSMLAKDPAERPRDMASLVRQLGRIEVYRS
jgi:serine/threonine protein kinase